MDIKDVSPEWSEQERLSVITQMANGARNRMVTGGGLSQTTIYIVLESITFVSAMPAAFLEASRRSLTDCLEKIK